jgi:hypothetical protein
MPVVDRTAVINQDFFNHHYKNKNMKNNFQNTASNAQCCVDYCQTSFIADGKEAVNNYKCNQGTFTSSDMWSIEKTRQEPLRTCKREKKTGLY